MRVTIQISALTSILFAASGALAGLNCKCQDGSVQYNGFTQACCDQQTGALIYYPGPNHQCASPSNTIDSGAFVQCCEGYGVGGGGAFCWD